MALQFSLNIGAPQCYRTTGNASKENVRDVDRVQREARREDVNAREGVSDLIEGLKSLLDSIGEKFEQTVVELKSAQEECKKMSEENLKLRTQIEQRLKTLEDTRVFLTGTLVGGTTAMPIPTTFAAMVTGTNTPAFGNTVMQVPATISGSAIGAFNTSLTPILSVAENYNGNLTNTSWIETIGIVDSTNTQPKTTQAPMPTGTNTTGIGNSIDQAPNEAKPAADKFNEPHTMSNGRKIGEVVASPTPVPQGTGTVMNASIDSRRHADNGIVSNHKGNNQ